MNPLKKLLGQTGIYGGTTIVGRFLNWLLVPLYTNIFPSETYGIVINLLAITAIAQTLLTYGTETGFFRFASDKSLKNKVFTSLFTSLFFTSLLFVCIASIFLSDIGILLGISGNEIFLRWLVLTLFFDILSSIPFAKLRLENKPVKFGVIKVINILINIGLNLFFLLLCPYIAKTNSDSWILYFYDQNLGIGYIFLAYLISAFITFLMLIPEFLTFRFSYIDRKLLGKILKYSFPILLVSMAGMINIQVDKTLLPHLLAENGFHNTGIYGANYKLSIVMILFVSAFRYAYEPFFFSQKKSKDSKLIYADVLKYFVIFGLLVFLVVTLYIDIFKYFIGKDYHEGLFIVPIILMANFFYGIFYSLSLWYKLTDKTKYGAYLAIGGVIITLSLNILLVPVIGFIGAAIATLVCFVAMSIASYLLGQKHYPIKYDLKSIIIYFLLSLILFSINLLLKSDLLFLRLAINTILILAFILFVFYKEPMLRKSVTHLLKKS